MHLSNPQHVFLSNPTRFNLEDVWRRRNPSAREYSWNRGNKQSRIDFWLISESLDTSAQVEHLNPSWSDHRAIKLSISCKNVSKGPGLWKMNCETIKSELFKKTFLNFWQVYRNEKNKYRDIQTWWDIGNITIQQIASEVSRLISNDRKEAEKQLSEQQKSPMNNNTNNRKPIENTKPSEENHKAHNKVEETRLSDVLKNKLDDNKLCSFFMADIKHFQILIENQTRQGQA